MESEVLENINESLEESLYMFWNENTISYSQNFGFVESFCETTIDSLLFCIQQIGKFPIEKIEEIAKTKSILLSTSITETCKFDKKETKTKVDDKIIQKVITKLHYYNWYFNVEEKIFLQGEKKEFLLQNQNSNTIIQTTNDFQPKPKIKINSKEINITILFQYINQSFKINKTNKNCYTPFHNNEIQKILQMIKKLEEFIENILNYNINNIKSFEIENKEILLKLKTINIRKYFNNEFLEKIIKNYNNSSKRNEISNFIISSLQNEMDNWIFLHKNLIDCNFSFFNIDKIQFQLIPFIFIIQICKQFEIHLKCLEKRIKYIFLSSIGRKIDKYDFFSCMNKRFQEFDKKPELFSYLIQNNENESSEGIIQILSEKSNPIQTFTKHFPRKSLEIQMNSIFSFQGEISIHGWMEFEFNNEFLSKYTIDINTKLFSSNIILLGHIIPENTFKPISAFLIRNKQSIQIPLILSKIPSAKTFKKSIQSLSNHQKDFASQIREKTLSTNLFCICIIPIRSQLEKLLKIPSRCLIKEILLAQSILDLFIEYQIPSDLFSFDTNLDLENNHTIIIDNIKENVHKIEKIIENIKNKEIEEKKKEEEQKQLEMKAKSSFTNRVTEKSKEILFNLRFASKKLERQARRLKRDSDREILKLKKVCNK